MGRRPLGQDPVQVAPDDRVPRVDQQLVRQGELDPAPPAVLNLVLGQEADLGRLYRLPQRRQVFDHQHAQEKGRLQGRADPGRDQSLAVHHPHAPDLPHRLPRNRAPFGPRHGIPKSLEGHRPSRAPVRPGAAHPVPARPRPQGVPRPDLRHPGLDQPGGLFDSARSQGGQAAPRRRGRLPHRRDHGAEREFDAHPEASRVLTWNVLAD